jgi:hypothetical protein
MLWPFERISLATLSENTAITPYSAAALAVGG